MARNFEQLDQNELDRVDGGIALLLPAVQSAREAARRTDDGQQALLGDGSVHFVSDTITF